MLHAMLMIPTVIVKPSLDDVQEVLMSAGKMIAGVAKGVAQWNAGSKAVKNVKCKSWILIISIKYYIYIF
jgi:dynein heavy chain